MRPTTASATCSLSAPGRRRGEARPTEPAASVLEPEATLPDHRHGGPGRPSWRRVVAGRGMRAFLLGLLLGALLPATALAAEPEVCGSEFRIVDWNTAVGGHPDPACNDNWNAGHDLEVVASIAHYVTAIDANVITLQEMSALGLAMLETALPDWDCRYQQFAYDDHLAVCVKGTASSFYAQRLANVTDELPDPPCDPEDPDPCDPPVCDPELAYWWGYVQVEFEGVLFTSVHTRSFWNDEHVDQLHDEVGSGVVAGDFNHTDPTRPPADREPPARPWYQTDPDEEWTWEGWRVDAGNECEFDPGADRCDPNNCTWVTRKIDHVLTVEEPATVWGEPHPLDDPLCWVNDGTPQALCDPTAPTDRRCKEGSNHRVVLTEVSFDDGPSIEATITNPQQPLEVDGSCAATVELRIDLHDRCCLDPDDLALQVTATNPTNNATLGPVSIDSIVAHGQRDVEVTGHVTVSALQSCPAEIVIDASAQSCLGSVGDTATQGTSASVLAVDTTPPEIGAADSALACLWPPNHRYVCFEAADLTPEVADNCATEPAWDFVACTSSQPDDGEGDGSTIDDCLLEAQSVCARAERAGQGPEGRRYDLEIEATDSCGNVSARTEIGHLLVPRSQNADPLCEKPHLHTMDGAGSSP